VTTYTVNSADHSPGPPGLHRLRAARVPCTRRATAPFGRAVLAQTRARMMDQVSMEL
jgi:hypothetical protein